MAQHQSTSPLSRILSAVRRWKTRLTSRTGDAIREGDVIGLIEVMKQFTEAHADRQK